MSASNSVVNFTDFVFKNRLCNEFIIPSEESLGYGAYGVVIKVKNKIDEKDYALKMVAIRDQSKPEFDEQKSMNQDFNDKIKELRIWAKLDLQYCVQYRSAWIEYDENSETRFLDIFTNSLKEGRGVFEMTYQGLDFAVLHIQMDLCAMSLRTALTQMEEHFDLKSKALLEGLPYFISSVIYNETIEAMNYLHTHKPHPIIHRDVKPENILIDLNKNDRCVKLGDFGLSVLHKFIYQSHTQNEGSDKYMAPEVRTSKNYSTIADVYSLGIIGQELFKVNINKSYPPELDSQYRNVIDMVSKASNALKKFRPDCADMVRLKKEWVMDVSAVKQEIDELVNEHDTYNDQDGFVLKFLQKQLFYK